MHPTDPAISIGGTQDNGTSMYRSDRTWNRVDYGDGGYARIDQSITSTTAPLMYHTYFNQTNNLIGSGAAPALPALPMVSGRSSGSTAVLSTPPSPVTARRIVSAASASRIA